MGKIEVDTLTDKCFVDCNQCDIHSREDGRLVCSNQFICKCGARAMLSELQLRFEEQSHEAYKKDIAGMKEHVVWDRAIKVLEEYME